MTNNQLTDAQISNATLIRLIRWADEHNSHYVAAALRELQERRKAAMDSKPVAWTDEQELRDVDRGGCGYLFTVNPITPHADERRIILLYRHAQPASGDGIEAAAKWIDQQREAYDSERGWFDPDTGSFEFGNDAQREYSSTLEELAEGIRALHPDAGNSPVIPDGWVMVPKEPTAEMQSAGASAIRIETTAVNKLWTGNAVFRAMLAAAPQEVK
ncbi:hypothetical protein R4U68_003822 [Raoultella ornithinolytica]|nr:hypothetical protein [Raoultella ornithinolytica]